MNNLTEFC